jgi:hypothetical protein
VIAPNSWEKNQLTKKWEKTKKLKEGNIMTGLMGTARKASARSDGNEKERRARSR